MIHFAAGGGATLALAALAAAGATGPKAQRRCRRAIAGALRILNEGGAVGPFTAAEAKSREGAKLNLLVACRQCGACKGI